MKLEASTTALGTVSAKGGAFSRRVPTPLLVQSSANDSAATDWPPRHGDSGAPDGLAVRAGNNCRA